MVSQLRQLVVVSMLSLGLLVNPVLGAIDDVFLVKRGSLDVGGCDGYEKDLQIWWQDSLTLATTALGFVNSANNRGDPYLKTFFQIDPTPEDLRYKRAVKAALVAVIKLMKSRTTPVGGQPLLFCSSKWLTASKMDALAINPSTGYKYDDMRKVSSVIKKPFPGEVPFFAPVWRRYVTGPPGDYCSITGAGGTKNLGATQAQTPRTTVTLCIKNFNIPRNALRDLEQVYSSKVNIKSLQVRSLTMYHELFHVALGPAKTREDANSYDLRFMLEHMETSRSIANPETYALFSLACYLDKISPGYTFASTRSLGIWPGSTMDTDSDSS